MRDIDKLWLKDITVEALYMYLPETFKGLSKDYLFSCIFNNTIQDNWKPSEGDIIVGPTGNVFVISSQNKLHESLGGDLYFFGGFNCGSGIIMDKVSCYTMNESGKWINYDENGHLKEMVNYNHSAISNFRYVPYPHEKFGISY